MTNARRILVAEPDGFDPQAMAELEALGEVTAGPFERKALKHDDGDSRRQAHRRERAPLASASRPR